MDGAIGTGDPGWDEARTRWRSAADRLWSGALTNAELYERAPHGVGLLLEQLRAAAATPEELLAVDADPGTLLPPDPAGTLVLGAACAARAEEIEAVRVRERRTALVATARAQGRTWVVLEEGLTRSVTMHVATGLALVAIDDPYREREPHGLGEAVLATDTGDRLAGHGAAEVWFAGRAERDAALEQRRMEIGSLDDDGSMVSDKQ